MKPLATCAQPYYSLAAEKPHNACTSVRNSIFCCLLFDQSNLRIAGIALDRLRGSSSKRRHELEEEDFKASASIECER